MFVVLDELNKYAPREGSGPIKEVLLDIAERGRSLGIILVGAQQTASEVEGRIVANAALRVVGRLDTAEAERPEYAFLTAAGRGRAGILKPGTMIVQQPEIPTPLLVRFPFPAWATRKSEVSTEAAARTRCSGVSPTTEPIHHLRQSVIMVRTQIQLEEAQVAALRTRAAAEGRSMADLIRASIDEALRGAPRASREERLKRALRAIGRFRSSPSDLSRRHDAYLAKAYE